MKDKLLRWILRILGVASVGATVTACYGVPYDEYEVKGKVLDGNDNPIEGILVTTEAAVLKENLDSLINAGVDLSAYFIGRYNWQLSITQVDGSFMMNSHYDFAEDLKVYALDIDGDMNGGKFKTAEASFEYVMQEGTEHFNGAAEYTTDEIIIVMETE